MSAGFAEEGVRPASLQPLSPSLLVLGWGFQRSEAET